MTCTNGHATGSPGAATTPAGDAGGAAGSSAARTLPAEAAGSGTEASTTTPTRPGEVLSDGYPGGFPSDTLVEALYRAAARV